MQQEIRWQYRFRNFSRAYSLLSEALERGVDDLNDLEKEGVIQRFEYTFELAWNTLKDRLEYDGVVMESVTPRNVIRTATATGLVADGQTWINILRIGETLRTATTLGFSARYSKTSETTTCTCWRCSTNACLRRCRNERMQSVVNHP